jgi:flagellar protein FlgJ
VAINPPSDLVLDVAAAAQPAKLQAAQARLQQARAESAGENFQAALDAAAETGGANAAASAIPVTTLRNAPLIAQEKNPAKAMQKFEAYFLQTAVEQMLPKDAENVFGSGLAGDVWKSMIAEQIAAEMAKSAKFGIAERLAGHHFAASTGRGTATSSAAVTRHDETTQGAKNLPFLQDIRSPALPTTSRTTAAAVKRS